MLRGSEGDAGVVNTYHKRLLVRILFLTYESWPTHRADLATLFGQYLPRAGIRSDLVAEIQPSFKDEVPPWEGGELITFIPPKRRPAQHVAKLWHNIRAAFGSASTQCDCIQVRDMSLSALFALVAARMRGVPFVYWLSFLQSEGHIARAHSRGRSAGFKYWYPLLEGHCGRLILYKLVLPRADHVFVQSSAMRDYLAARGVPFERMTPVPMGVDLEKISPRSPAGLPHEKLAGKRVLVYLGVQDQVRRVDVLLEMVAILKRTHADVLLVMAGDTDDASHREWLRNEAARLGVEKHILWTGWMPMTKAWEYVAAAEVGLSPCPRGELFDVSSPTKAVEYLALGVPVVCNDIPDQQLVIDEGGGGYCVPMDAAQFADAVRRLLDDPEAAAEMARSGCDYVRRTRSYHSIGEMVAAQYKSLHRRRGDIATQSALNE